MYELLVGYARVSTEQRDFSVQRNGLHAVSVMIASTSTTALTGHQSRPTRIASPGRLPSRRHHGGNQIEPAGTGAAGRSGTVVETVVDTADQVQDRARVSEMRKTSTLTSEFRLLFGSKIVSPSIGQRIRSTVAV